VLWTLQIRAIIASSSRHRFSLMLAHSVGKAGGAAGALAEALAAGALALAAGGGAGRSGAGAAGGGAAQQGKVNEARRASRGARMARK
jgi:hypothetical protein